MLGLDPGVRRMDCRVEPGNHDWYGFAANPPLRVAQTSNRGVDLVALALEMTDLIGRHGEPVPVTGGPGTVALFHPYLVHGSGHNMSIHSRWHLYFVYNAVSNTMTVPDNPRPSFKAQPRAVPLQVRDEPTTQAA